MSEQFIYGGTTDLLDNASAQTLSAYGNRISAPSWSPSLCPGAGTAGELLVEVRLNAPGIGNKWTFNFKLNGVTKFSVEISGGANTGYDASTFAVVAGDRLEIEVVPDNSPVAANVAWCWTWVPTTADNTMLCVTTDSNELSGSAAENLAVSGAMERPRASATDLYFPMGGTLTAMYALISAAPGVGNKLRRFHLRLNGAIQAALNIDISGTNTTGNATGASIAVADGDYVRIQSRNIGFGDPAANVAYVSLGLAFTPAWPDFFLVGSNSEDSMPTGSAIKYRQPSTGGAATSWDSDYFAAFAVTHRVEIERMRVLLEANPPSGLYVVGLSASNGPRLTFTPAGARSQLSVMPKILNEGDDWTTLTSAQSVGAPSASKASVCYAMRVPPDEGAPFMF